MKAHMNDLCGSIVCLSKSPQRLQALDALRDTQMDLRDLMDVLDCPRTTLQRNLSLLEERGWIENTASGYATTTTGGLVLTKFAQINETVETIETLTPFLNATDAAAEIDVDHLEDPRVTTPRPGRPNAPTKRLFESFTGADRVRGFLPTVSSLLVELSITDEYGAIEQEYVISREGLDALYEQYTDEPTDATETDRSAAHIEIRVYEENLPYGLFVSGNRLAIAGYDKVGRIEALVESTSEKSVAWGREMHETYREQSEPHEKELFG